MAYGKPHFVYIPGDVSIDVFESLRMAIEKIRPRHRRLKNRGYSARPLVVRPVLRRRPNLPIATRRISHSKLGETPKAKATRVRRELLDAGITLYGLLKAESRILPKILHPNEHVEALVYGQHRSSSVMLIATDERIIYLDNKPMSVFLDEVSYEVVSGLEFEIHLFFANLVLHTPVKNYDIHFANLRCAERFARHIEAHRLKREQPEKEKDFERQHLGSSADLNEPYAQDHKNMAGYYWLPIEEDEEHHFQARLLSEEQETPGQPSE